MKNNEELLRLRKEFQTELKQGDVSIRQFVDRRGFTLHNQNLLSLLNVAVMHSLRNGELFDVESLINDFPNFPEAGIRATASRARKVMAESYCPVNDLDLRTIGDGIQLKDESFRDSTGIVYAATSDTTEVPLEVKLMFPIMRPISNQFKTLKKFGHPGISKLIEFGNVSSFEYVVHERPTGKTLKSICKYPAKIPLLNAVKIFMSILDAVDHCHCMGLVFRTIRPEYIWVESDTPVISSFELSPALKGRGNDDSTESSTDFQTVSPVAQDIFSLGVLFYGMLTGINPFRFDRDGKYFRYPSEYRDGIDQELETICLNAISDTPSNQIKSARQFKDLLETWCAGAKRSAEAAPPHFQHKPSNSQKSE